MTLKSFEIFEKAEIPEDRVSQFLICLIQMQMPGLACSKAEQRVPGIALGGTGSKFSLLT